MRFSSWLRNLRTALPSPQRRRPNPDRARLGLECLEERTLPSFSPVVAYPVGSGPQAVAVGYFNNDSIRDLAVANSGSGTVSVLAGNADGTFQAAVNLAADTGTRSLAVGDLDQDGFLDIVTANQGSLSLIFHDNGTFQAPVNVAFQTPDLDNYLPTSVALGDLNGDATLDLVATFNVFHLDPTFKVKSTSVHVMVFLNTVTTPPPFATLTLTHDYVIGTYSGFVSSTVDSVQIATINGQPSVVFVNTHDNSVNVMSGNGAGDLQSPTQYSTGSSPRSVAVSDVNNDGIKDLVTANQGSNDVSVLLGNADGTFQAAVSYGAGSGPTAVAIGDINNDGRADLAVTHSGGVNILLGFGDGAFQTAGTYLSGTSTAAVAMADFNFNSDTAPDLAVVNAGEDFASVLLNDGDWTTPLASISGPSTAVPNQTLTFTLKAIGGGSPANTTFNFDIDWNGDGTVDETVSGPSGTTVTHAFATNGSYTIIVTATDLDGHTSAPATQAVSILFEAGIAGPALGARNQPLTFTLSTSVAGLPANTLFSYAIDWDGDGTVDQIVNGPSGATVAHSYATGGLYTIKMTATVNGQTSAGVSLATTILTFLSFQADPGDPTKLALVVDGTAGADTIILSAATGNGVTVSMNGTTVGTFAPSGGTAFGHVIVNAGDGNDVVRLTGGLTVSALLFGGNGNDTLDALGSVTANALQGGSGNDILTGGAGNDVLIGGLGADTVNGSGGDDIVIGGTTSYDSNQGALCSIMAEWGRTDATYSTRVSHLQAPPKGKGGVAGLNGPYFLNTSTVFDDAAIDDLRGGTGMDWFFVKQRGGTADKLEDRAKGETVTNL